MARALLIVLLVTAFAEPAEACTPPECRVFLHALSPKPDAGGVATNIQLLAWAPSGAADFARLQRPDGGDGDGGVPLTSSVIRVDGCSALFRFRPSRELLPRTDYELRFETPDGGFGVEPFENRSVTQLSPLFFRTGDGADLSPPAPPVASRLDYSTASCSSCGPFGGGASVAFEASDAVWFSPLDTKYQTNGGAQGFFVPFSCAVPGASGIGEGEYEMKVIAFDSAWNSSEPTSVELVTNCNGLDPCTGARIDDPQQPAPLRGFSGCGCASSSTLLALLASAVLARVISRRR